MHILCLGINHESAPLDLRERLAFDAVRARATLSRYGFGQEPDPAIAGLVILSTCSRVEIYANSPQVEFGPLGNLLAEATGVEFEAIEGHAYTLADRQAVQHIFRVAAGLDSMVLGEAQILGQVAAAHTLALSMGSSGMVLARLFQGAVHAGKRARHETDIGLRPANLSAVAVHLVSGVVQQLGTAQVLVIGAGEMAELAVEALRKRNVRRITVVNRSIAHGQELGRRWEAAVRPFEALPQELALADVVVSSTGAPHVVIHTEMVEQAMAARPGRPLVMVDLAVPRDVDQAAGCVPGVRIFDLDQLQHHLTHSIDHRRAHIPAVEAILSREVDVFDEWLGGLEVRPLIRDLRQQAEAIRRAEVERTLRRMNGSGPQVREELEALTRALVNKLLHAPTRCLKEKSKSGLGEPYALTARELFDLSTASDAPEGGRL